MGIKCKKCQGLVVEDSFRQEDRWLPGFRCVNCGHIKIDEEKVKYANQKTNRRINKLDELELYRTRGRYIERSSYSIQHK